MLLPTAIKRPQRNKAKYSLVLIFLSEFERKTNKQEKSRSKIERKVQYVR